MWLPKLETNMFAAATIVACLVGELSIRCDRFRQLWARHDSRPKRSGTVRLEHPVVGPLELSGYVAWVAWLALHLVYLVGFKSKIITLISWTTTFLTMSRGQLSITGRQARVPWRAPPNPIQRSTPHTDMRSKR